MSIAEDDSPKKGFSYYKKLTLSISIIVILVFSCVFIVVKELNNTNNNEDEELAIKQEQYLLSQMEPINNKYTITNKNQEEIILQNYSLGSVDIFDKYGTEVAGFIINNQTIYHNWYTIEENENGILNIKMETVDRQEEKNHLFNGQPWIIHDRALKINLSPYNELSFASLNGKDESKNWAYTSENSSKIKYDVKTNVTEFVTTKIIDIIEGPWNSTHTLQFCDYEIQLVKIIFENCQYKKATIMEYRFVAKGTVSEELTSIYED